MDLDSLTWAVAEGEHNHHPLLIRYREIPPEFPKSKYPQRLNIFWNMSETHENGLPTHEESKRLATFEDRLVDAVEQNEHAVLVGVLTSNGEREFIFHTTDVAGFLQCLSSMPQAAERYPITIQKYDDPDWKYFESVIPQEF